MGLKADDEHRLGALGEAARLAHHRLMAEMDAVKIADAHHPLAKALRQVVQRAIEPLAHGDQASSSQ